MEPYHPLSPAIALRAPRGRPTWKFYCTYAGQSTGWGLFFRHITKRPHQPIFQWLSISQHSIQLSRRSADRRWKYPTALIYSWPSTLHITTLSCWGNSRFIFCQYSECIDVQTLRFFAYLLSTAVIFLSHLSGTDLTAAVCEVAISTTFLISLWFATRHRSRSLEFSDQLTSRGFAHLIIGDIRGGVRDVGVSFQSHVLCSKSQVQHLWFPFAMNIFFTF